MPPTKPTGPRSRSTARRGARSCAGGSRRASIWRSTRRRTTVSPSAPPPRRGAPAAPRRRPRAAAADRAGRRRPAGRGAPLGARARRRAPQTLDELREVLEKFDGCGLKATATQLVFSDGAPDARDHAGRRGAGRRRGPDRPPVRRPRRPVARPHAGRDRARPHARSISPMSCPGARPAIARRRRRRRRSACRSSAARSNSSRRGLLVCLGASSAQTLLGVKEGITRVARPMVRLSAGRGGRSRRCRCFTRPICCASPRRNAPPGAICARSPRRWRSLGRGGVDAWKAPLRLRLLARNCSCASLTNPEAFSLSSSRQPAPPSFRQGPDEPADDPPRSRPNRRRRARRGSAGRGRRRGGAPRASPDRHQRPARQHLRLTIITATGPTTPSASPRRRR